MASYVKRDQAAAYDPAALVARDAKVKDIQANPTKYQVPIEGGGVRFNDEALALMMMNPSIGVMRFDTPAPTAQNVTQAEPQVPKGWNPSRREVAELANPTVDHAGAAQAAARGEFANQGVLGEAAARSQQLADPTEEPLTSSNKGILARVMGGEI
jgi:hypothetical protein